MEKGAPLMQPDRSPTGAAAGSGDYRSLFG